VSANINLECCKIIRSLSFDELPLVMRSSEHMANKVTIDVLRRLEPISSMSEARLSELAELCYLEHVDQGVDPFKSRGTAGQSVYLVKGELELVQADGVVINVSDKSDSARRPLGKSGLEYVKVIVVTESELVRIDDDLLDIMVTWDQLASVQLADAKQRSDGNAPTLENWSILSGMFSISNLRYGAFSQLPSANIEELLKRFKRYELRAGQVIIKEGTDGDFYYVVESGKCMVERMVGGVSMFLAELKSGDAFGEEALVSDAKRNATVIMKTDGALLRLDKKDFVELLREPLLQKISSEDARQKIENGGQWLDVRYPSEYQYDKMTDALNIPLAEIRNAFGVLDKEKEYVIYCQSGRRSSAAAFLLAQQGFKAFLLKGGLWGGEGS
jgi:rhodanese-related sulfurtransferase